MRIACVTPFFEGNSVGSVAERIGLEMQKAGHEVALIGTGRPPYWKTGLELITLGEFGRLDPERLRGFDAVVYHVGNHPSSSPILWLMERVPGIVILHDRFYADAYYAYGEYLAKPKQFGAIAEGYYGAEGLSFAWRFASKDILPEEMHRFTFLEPLLKNATAAVVHYDEYGDQIRALANIPVESSYRPGYPIVESPSPALRGGAEFMLAYVGCVTRHRCLPLLFEVLRARPDLLARTRLAVVGLIEDPEYAEYLQRLAVEYGIDREIVWAFNATDERKHQILASADAAFNCRTLNSEGLSGSLMEQMSHGLPVIVNANGFALEAPADAVCFVAQDAMREGIERAMEMLIRDPEERRAIGKRARLWAQNDEASAAYAAAIVRLAEAAGIRSIVSGVCGRIRGLLDDMDMRDDAVASSLNGLVVHLLGGENFGQVPEESARQ